LTLLGIVKPFSGFLHWLLKICPDRFISLSANVMHGYWPFTQADRTHRTSPSATGAWALPFPATGSESRSAPPVCNAQCGASRSKANSTRIMRSLSVRADRCAASTAKRRHVFYDLPGAARAAELLFTKSAAVRILALGQLPVGKTSWAALEPDQPAQLIAAYRAVRYVRPR